MLDRLIREGHMPQGCALLRHGGAVRAGQVAMMINGPWAWDNVARPASTSAWRRSRRWPAKPGKPFVGVLGCMITAPSKIKDIAREFIENHLLKVESLKTVSADVPLGTPANKAYYAELASTRDPRHDGQRAAGEPIPNIPEMGASSRRWTPRWRPSRKAGSRQRTRWTARRHGW
jgi:maltose/maltodextrin transport system substrate-binding protein